MMSPSQKIYYEKNKELLREKRRKRYANNKVQEKLWQDTYRSNNYDRINARRREMYALRRDAKKAELQKQFMIILDQ
jgi:hypothetical protein